MARTEKAFSGESNRDRIEATLARRRSGAAGPMGSRNTRRTRTRRDALRSVLRAEGVRF